jgi:putative DNA methylase
MTYRKKLIEVALPLEAINVASAREKSIRHGHPSTLHLWWARRPLAACRAVIFTSLVDDPDDPEAPPEFVEACKQLPSGKNSAANDTPRQRLFDFIERLVTWEATTDEVILEKARELIRLCTNGNPPPLLDPFAGGGSIPLEAQRLGLEAHASDLNPVAVMINKALIEIPPKFADMPPVNPRDRSGTATGSSWKGAAGLAADVRYYGEWMREKAWERVGHLYPKCNEETVIAWLWARTVKCPNPACGAQMPLISSFWLSKKKGKRSWIEPIIDKKKKEIRFQIKHGSGEPPPPSKVSRGANFKCLICSEVSPDQHLKDEGMAGRLGTQLMAIVTDGPGGRSFHAPIQGHEEIAQQSKPQWKPTGELVDDTRAFWCKLYGLVDFSDLFTSRQLVSLTTYSELVSKVREQIYLDALASELPEKSYHDNNRSAEANVYADAVSLYLGMAVSKLADAQNSLCRWKVSATQVIALYSRQAIPMVWDFAESNIFANWAGDYLVTVNTMARAIERFNNKNIGYAYQNDARFVTNDHLTVISTDPPYYDNIGYADLSDFFYVWLRSSLRNIYPDIFSTLLVPKKSELVASSHKFDGNSDAANEHFESGLFQSFTNMRNILISEYPLTVYYAFKQQEIVAEKGTASTGWETMLNGLIETGFSIVGTWPIRTELSNRMIASGTNALASSIVLVCRPRSDEAPMTSRREFVNTLRHELPNALGEMLSGNIAPVDLAQASIGPGMAVYSRYSKVLEPDGSPLTVRTALQIINHELDAYLAEQEGEMDADSRFAVAWFEQFGFSEGGFGQADVLARAKNTSVEGLASAGVLESGAGKVRLLGWDEFDPGWDPVDDTRLTVWETVHHLIERLNSHGEEGAARLLAKLSPEMAADTRQMAYRLYSVCERKNWAEHARDYNALVVSWGASQEQAREFKEQYQQRSLF